ncbi:aldehyde dehydrogenase family protein [Bacillus sp. DJP31]|uniref:aldehyde dehydrogenase family protein n=1 Tax=Bacillus sp. DJP31 TaxID=3409789 RepID=UPI003BB7A65F
MTLNQSLQTAMEVSRKAGIQWGQSTINERIKAIKLLDNYLRSHLEQLLLDIQKITKKSNMDVLTGEFHLLFEAIKYYKGIAPKLLKKERKKTPFPNFNRKSYVQYEPIGVCLLFSPWNYPLQLSILPMISALLAGNTVILKPSEHLVGFSAILKPLLQSMNLPEGVIQVVDGGADIGKGLIDQKPDKIFFTGSQKVGKQILRQASEHFIQCDLELSGKDPLIVFEDCDLERAANAAVWGAFVNGGQVCVSVERVYVQETVYDRFLEKVKEKSESLQLDDLARNLMTTTISFINVREQIQKAIEDGAALVTEVIMDEQESYIAPTILKNVNHSMAIMREETFGPVLPIMSFSTEEEAIRLANDSPFGLNAYVFSKDKDRIERVVRFLESGNVYVNDVILNVSNIHLPFGGVKESGMGRYHGVEGLLTFTQSKSVMIYSGNVSKNMNWYPYSSNALAILKKWYKRWS